ncbi:LysR family transcriptional regulator [Vibrio crassostreae]|uniref:LysR family transcriptional regulator n=1 Tax=Vibrio crassostreae TaxID=246167 RepID=UPI001B306394|nr:LysR family transcriptional regulator [Vibrio crassostreae]CAK3512970.1 LysR family transcriptional regulator [Vibrio crassostreae]CAK3516417.1 LysR family transcriptional regulator [Vibrio crassostreae]CAK3913073.1 LysR family transcriptional regulator [Vibrio crassostreae]
MKSNLDLNLLIVLILLDKNKNIKSVAKALGKTESAISKHLTKLRAQLKDPLFVKVGSNYEPSIYMQKVLPIILSGIDTLESIKKHQPFDPLSYEKEIVIALPSIIQYWRGDNILLDIIKTFPKAKVTLSTWEDHSEVAMSNGHIDIGIHYFNPDLPQNIYQQRIGRMLPKLLTSSSLKEHDFKKLIELPFFWLTNKGAFGDGPSIITALNKNGIYPNTVGKIDTVECLLNIIRNSKSATIIHCFNEAIEGVHITNLPGCSLYEQPLIVANYRLASRDTPLTKLLVKIMTRQLNEIT